jgi:hypothetical protein
MKKLLLTLGLALAWLLGNAQNFTPEAGVFYNLKQTISGLVVGPSVSAGISSTQPSVVALTNKKSQAFEFIPVDGKPGTYYMLNGEGMYLNMFSTVSRQLLDFCFLKQPPMPFTPNGPLKAITKPDSALN